MNDTRKKRMKTLAGRSFMIRQIDLLQEKKQHTRYRWIELRREKRKERKTSSDDRNEN